MDDEQIRYWIGDYQDFAVETLNVMQIQRTNIRRLTWSVFFLSITIGVLLIKIMFT